MFLILRFPRPPRATLFPYTTLFRSLMDEPTVGLDPASRSDLIRLMLTMRAERKVAVLWRSEEHTSELQSQFHLVCRLLLEKKKIAEFALDDDSKHGPRLPSALDVSA